MTAAALTANALRVLEARYLRRDAAGRIVESPAELFARVSRAVALAESDHGGPAAARRWEEEFARLLESLEFLPNSPTLMNAGTPLGQLSACFVLPVHDSIEAIFESLKKMALVQRSGGGTGFSFSRLRPRGDPILSTGGTAAGPVSFLRVFDSVAENVRHGGKRRGANMGILRVDHPDIREFIAAKLDRISLRNFNISVAVTDAFLHAVEAGADYDLVHPRSSRTCGRLPAREVFDAIVDAAWQSGDPGLVFLDAIDRANPTPQLGAIESTNPCGEVPLLPHEACNLGSINLARMIRSGANVAAVDWERLRRVVRISVRFLDDVVEVNSYPLPETAAMSRGNRKIGLGVMGFAELLILLGISYDSAEAVETAERLMAAISEAAREASLELAAERGVYPNWQGSVHAARGLRLRNATLTAIAPTGTLGIIAGTSAGIEPLFALAYRRCEVLEGETLYEVSPAFLAYLESRGEDAQSVAADIYARGGLASVSGLPEEARKLFVTALEIPAERHLEIQAAFQRHVDNSVSKTINLPFDASAGDVASAYWRAWKLGLKGITVYRYGSRERQVLELGRSQAAGEREHKPRCDPGECEL